MLLDTVLPVDEESLLISKAQGGDKQAFSHLVETHELFVHDVCCRIVGDLEDGEDLAQETFLRAYRGLKRFRGQSAFRTWLYRIAVNLCLSHKTRHRPVAVSSTDLDEEVPSAMPQPEEDALHREFLEGVRAAFAALPVDQRALLVLRDVKGLSYDEIAAILKCPVGTVRSRLSRARLALRTRLRERELFGGNRV